VKERSIMFSSLMVRALLAGWKAQRRRLATLDMDPTSRKREPLEAADG
jgi:hypothetical protein